MKYNILFFCLLIQHLLIGQTIYEDKVYKESIKTPQLFLKGLPFTKPILDLRPCEAYEDEDDVSVSRLQLLFDDINSDIENYYYKIIHCNADWTASNLVEMDFLEGFNNEQIDDADYGFSTLVPYTQYNLTIPNSDVCWTKSGNYALVVYEDDDEESIILTRRFIVVERQMNIVTQVQRARNNLKYRTHQEINFKVLHPNTEITNPRNDIKISIVQNGDWGTAINGLKPSLIKDKELIYDYQDKVVFQGGKEFRRLDLRTLHVNSPKVKHPTQEFESYYIPLKDEDLARKPYFYTIDANGRFVIDNQIATNSLLRNSIFDQARNNRGNQELPTEQDIQDFEILDQQQNVRRINLESDYGWVNFSITPENYRIDGRYYVMGAFSDWRLSPEFELEYSRESDALEGAVFMKQGYYNYRYVFVPKGDTQPDLSQLEGNWHETENEYQIIVYYRPFGERYDRVVGYKLF